MLRANEKPPPGQPASLVAGMLIIRNQRTYASTMEIVHAPPPDVSQGAVREERRGASQIHPLLRGTHAHYESAMSKPCRRQRCGTIRSRNETHTHATAVETRARDAFGSARVPRQRDARCVL